jgi:hypothetical protein
MSILITQFKFGSKHILNINKYNISQIETLMARRTRQVTKSVNNRQIKVRNIYTDQWAPQTNRITERIPLV